MAALVIALNDSPGSNDEPRAPVPKYWLTGLTVGLIVWGAYLAVGAAYSTHNIWRGVVVAVCSLLFLAWFWGLQRLYARRHRKR